MNAPAMTYRDRAIKAEARVAELEDEIAAWRSYGHADPKGRSEETDIELLSLLQRRLRDLTGFADTRAIAKTLLVLLAHAGKICRRATIFAAIALNENTELKVVDVRMSRVRAALRIIGYPSAITTVWGEGYVLAAEAAPDIRRTLGLPPGDAA